MLVISRKCDQEVLIGGRIRLRILSVRGNRVQLGIDAPLEVPVHRAENFARFEDGPCGDPRGEPAGVGVPA
jgi:carbon storage regulator